MDDATDVTETADTPMEYDGDEREGDDGEDTVDDALSDDKSEIESESDVSIQPPSDLLPEECGQCSAHRIQLKCRKCREAHAAANRL